MKKVAIIYHYSAHYRLGVFQELCRNSDPVFTIISGQGEVNDIKLIDSSLAKVPIEKGGLRWLFIKNKWITKDKFLWQTGILTKVLKNNFDFYIFLGNPYFISTWIASMILRFKKVPFFYWTHGVTKHEQGIKGSIRNVFNKLPNGLLLYGNYAKKILIAHGFDYQKLHVIYNSLNYSQQIEIRKQVLTKEITDLRKSIFINPNLPQLLFIGRLTKQKRLPLIIDAMKVLQLKSFKTNLLIVGDGDEAKTLKEYINHCGLNDYVHFYGSSYDESVNAELIAASDICVSPGEVGLTAMHSLIYGTPVITHDNFENQMPEFEAINPGFSGDFFKENDVNDLAEKIKVWLTEHPDRLEVRKYCYEIIDKKYNPSYQREKICKIIIDEKIN